MSKEKEEIKDTTFEGFNFLDSPVPEPIDDVKSGKKGEDLTEEDLEILNKEIEKKTAKSETNISKKDKSDKTETIEKEVEFENDIENKVEEEVEEVVEEETDYTTYAKYMAENGILDLDENTEVKTEEDLKNIQLKTIENKVNAWKSSYPEDVQQFLEYVEMGGDPKEFHKHFYEEITFETFKPESEEDHKYIIEEYLKSENFTAEEIADELELLTDTGRLEKKSEIYLSKLQKKESEHKKSLLEAQAKYAEAETKRKEQDWNNFKNGLFEKEEISGFKFTPKMKQDLWDYMTKPANKKTGETQYQIDSKENQEARYIFAYLLKNKWDTKSLEKQVETKKVAELRSKLSNYSDSRKKIGGSPKTNIEREDRDEKNPFKGLKF